MLCFKHLALYLSKLVQPGVQVSCVDQPGDQRPSLLWLACHKPPMSFLCHFTVSLLWVPAPVVAPGFIGPNGSRNDANGPWQVLLCRVKCLLRFIWLHSLVYAQEFILRSGQEAEAQQQGSVREIIQGDRKLIILRHECWMVDKYG